MDKEGFLYVADVDNGDVRRQKDGEKQGTIVAGGNGKGDRLNQLSHPSGVLVDRWGQVYTADSRNHRVMR
jgi:hypothetical protein